MQINQNKFQATMLGLQGFLNCKSLNLNGIEIKCEHSGRISFGETGFGFGNCPFVDQTFLKPEPALLFV